MKTFNPWHNVHIGAQAPEIVKAIIEIPRGSKGKYELDKETGLLNLNRVLFSAVYSPCQLRADNSTANFFIMMTIRWIYWYLCSIDLEPHGRHTRRKGDWRNAYER